MPHSNPTPNPIPEYRLRIETGDADRAVVFRLYDPQGVLAADRALTLPDPLSSLWEGLFDTQRYVALRAGNQIWQDQPRGQPDTPEALLERLGVFLGREVLGEEIMTVLTRSRVRRALAVHLPGGDSPLTAALARVPWEIARPHPGAKPLMDTNLVPRLVLAAIRADPLLRAGGTGPEPLRVLFVFAEAPGSRPLAMGREREELRSLFYRDILPNKQVQVDFLCHGVTEAILRRQIEASGGYHIIHWSGHGQHNRLELTGPDGGGGSQALTGEELLALFVDAGGFFPQLVFLSACHAGALTGTDQDVGQGIRDRTEFQEILTGIDSPPPNRPHSAESWAESWAESRDTAGARQQGGGYTGTALALLAGGVPQVIAMRYAVGDDYAKELAVWFYRHLLADAAGHDTGSALDLARRKLARGKTETVDHASPILLGEPHWRAPAPAGRSEQLNRVHPRPQPLLPAGIQELDPLADFTGRGALLTALNTRWLSPEGGTGVALLQGLAGMGKTALAAEAIHLWHGRFDYVLAVRTKPVAMGWENYLQRLDIRLALASPVYRQRCEANPLDRIYLEPDREPDSLDPDERRARMRANLLEVLRAERILLVLDNFETQLNVGVAGVKRPKRKFPVGRAKPGASPRHTYPCRDPDWDKLLTELVLGLPGTGSRLLLTSRHRPGLSPDPGALWLPLGPLPAREAALFLRNHPHLQALIETEEFDLLERLLTVSRGHPLILDRLARLAADRDNLARSLERLERDKLVKGLPALPDFFGSLSGDGAAAAREKEQRYLEETAVGAVHLLIEGLTPVARQLLWVMTLAHEPVSEAMLRDVWDGRSAMEKQIDLLRESRQDIEAIPAKRAQLEALLTQISPALRARLEAPPPPAPDPGPLLEELVGTGLVNRVAGPDAAGEGSLGSIRYEFHELVRECMAARVKPHPQDTGGRSRAAVWMTYGERYGELSRQFRAAQRPGSAEAAAELGRRGLVYLVQAGTEDSAGDPTNDQDAYDKLTEFATELVTGTHDPVLLRGVIVELTNLAEGLAPGKTRWRLRATLADALVRSGQPDRALALYQQAGEEAEAARYWVDAAWIRGNWAGVLVNTGKPVAAEECYLKCAKTLKKAGRPETEVIQVELDRLRMALYGGKIETALPEIEKRLKRLRGWWRRGRDGKKVAEAPNRAVLARALANALDCATYANRKRGDWARCLALLEEIEEVEKGIGESRYSRYRTRFNRYGPLMELGRLSEAQALLEACLAVYREADDLEMQSNALSGLADVRDKRGDARQAVALERQALSVANRLPGPLERGISHGNLARYLTKIAEAKTARAAVLRKEERGHRLAAGCYYLLLERWNHLNTWLENLGILRAWAAENGSEYVLPRLADILAQPAFEPLARFIAERGVTVEQLQGALDRIIEEM